MISNKFQSTHPLRGATRLQHHVQLITPNPLSTFQSTHPARGATVVSWPTASIAIDFNPRTPCGVRRGGSANSTHIGVISIHAPLAGCDLHSPASDPGCA